MILVNFFGTSDVSRGWEILTNLEWLKGNSDEQQESKKLLVEKAKEKKLPGDLEVDLKKLYTAVTRCRSDTAHVSVRSHERLHARLHARTHAHEDTHTHARARAHARTGRG